MDWYPPRAQGPAIGRRAAIEHLRDVRTIHEGQRLLLRFEAASTSFDPMPDLPSGFDECGNQLQQILKKVPPRSRDLTTLWFYAEIPSE